MDNNFSVMPSGDPNQGNIPPQQATPVQPVESSQVPSQVPPQMPPRPTMQYGTATINPSTPPSHHALGKILAILIALAIVVVGVGYALGYISLPTGGVDTNKFFSTIYEKNKNVNSGEMNLNFKIKALPITDELVGERISFGVDPKSSQGKSMKTQFAPITDGELVADLKYAYKVVDSELSADLNIKTSFSFSAANFGVDLGFRLTPDNMFFSLNKFPLAMLGIPSEVIKIGKWYSLPKEIMDSAEFKKYKAEMTDPENIAELNRIKQSLATALDQIKPVKVIAQGKAEVDGQKVYKYSLKLQPENFKDFALALVDIYKSTPDAPEIKDADIQSLSDKMDDLAVTSEFNRIMEVIDRNADVTVYVASDGTPVKVDFSVDIIPDADSQAILADSYINISASATYSKVGEDISIEAPINFEIFDMQKIAPLLFMGPGGGVPVNQKAGSPNLKALPMGY